MKGCNVDLQEAARLQSDDAAALQAQRLARVGRRVTMLEEVRREIDAAYQRGYDDGNSGGAGVFTGLFVGASVVGVLCYIGNALGLF